MGTEWKVFALLVCFVGFNLFMFTWKTNPKVVFPELQFGIFSVPTSVSIQNTTHVTSSIAHMQSALLQLENTWKGYRNIRQFYLDQLRSTLPNSPQVYQGKPDYDSRQRKTNEICKHLNTRNRHFYSNLLLQERYGLVFCEIPKVGSTFWRRTFDILKKNNNITSPFLIGYNELAPLTKLSHKPNSRTLKQNSTKFMFTREPYERLFSAYISKLVVPWMYYWKDIGKPIVKNFRKTPTKQSINCGHDVTFPELVKYVNTGRLNDIHFLPQNKICNPCDVKYDVIGKMESFKDDALYMLDSVGALNKDIRFYDLAKEHQQDTMLDLVLTVFNKRDVYSKCLSVHMAMKRVWRVYQIRGLLDKTLEYPLTEKESSNITLSQFMALAIAAHRKSVSSARGNKREAFLQAYQEVPMEDLKLLQKYYDKDFKLFGYPSEPEDLFKRNNEAKTKHSDFNYFDFT